MRIRIQLSEAEKKPLLSRKTEWKTIWRGWWLEPRTFREQLLELIGSPQRGEGNDEEIKEPDEQKPND